MLLLLGAFIGAREEWPFKPQFLKSLTLYWLWLKFPQDWPVFGSHMLSPSFLMQLDSHLFLMSRLIPSHFKSCHISLVQHFEGFWTLLRTSFAYCCFYYEIFLDPVLKWYCLFRQSEFNTSIMKGICICAYQHRQYFVSSTKSASLEYPPIGFFSSLILDFYLLLLPWIF